MSLTTPILNSVPAWDTINGQTFTFNVIGGDLVVGNKLTIINEANSSDVHIITTTSNKYQSVVPANELTNGVYYRAYVQTQNNNGNWSGNSNVIKFYCFATPNFSITGVTSRVTTSYIISTLNYSQSNGEALNDYRFILYDTAYNPISESEVIYTGVANTIGTAMSYTASYRFQGLIDGTYYHIKAVGHTTGGTYIETASIDFLVEYTTPDEYSVLYLQNNCIEGYITYYSKASIISGTKSASATYIDGQAINLLTSGSYVLWDDGFVMNDDFTMKLWVSRMIDNSTLVTLTDSSTSNRIELQYIVDALDDTLRRAILQVYQNNIPTYFIYSNSFRKPTNAQKTCVQVRRINNVYHIMVEVGVS